MRSLTYEQALITKGPQASPLKLATTAVLLLAAVSTIFVFYQDAQSFNSAPRTIPLIVAWTKYFSHTLKEPLLGTLKNCRYQCEFIDRNELTLYNRSASAFVMHGRDLNVSDLPKPGPYHMNVLFLLESPHHSGSQIYRVPPNFFNATITYRKDSRYFYPYGYFSPLAPNDDNSSIITEEQLLAAVRRKKRGSLIFVSNCHTSSKREDIIRELGRFSEVTVRGGCEKQLLVNPKLGSSSCKSECSDNELIATHRFYIAFENSICNDYITEKFFVRASQMLVPVVMKRRYYERAGIPPRAFIALDDFRTTKELGDYLNFLRANDTEYMKYFEWTEHFRRPDKFHSNALCKLCEDIYNGEKVTLDNIKKYYEENQCI